MLHLFKTTTVWFGLSWYKHKDRISSSASFSFCSRLRCPSFRHKIRERNETISILQYFSASCQEQLSKTKHILTVTFKRHKENPLKCAVCIIPNISIKDFSCFHQETIKIHIEHATHISHSSFVYAVYKTNSQSLLQRQVKADISLKYWFSLSIRFVCLSEKGIFIIMTLARALSSVLLTKRVQKSFIGYLSFHLIQVASH